MKSMSYTKGALERLVTGAKLVICENYAEAKFGGWSLSIENENTAIVLPYYGRHPREKGSELKDREYRIVL